ncbi:MAG: DUF1109 domain-containing protein [Sphaerospermopsis sp. SIO1G2]|nr:DUF1109 domain-containing protein [Sphaerospermopsis sp. SIO1G2]
MREDDALIAQLVRELYPVGRTKPWLHIVRYLGVMACYILVCVFILGTRDNMSNMLRTNSSYVCHLLISLSIMIGAAIIAILLTIPGHQNRRLLTRATRWMLVATTIILIYISSHSSMIEWKAAWDIQHVKVTGLLLALSVAPAAILIIITRMNAPTILPFTGASVALASCSCAYMILKLTTADDTIAATILWCYVPIIFTTALCYRTARLWLRW